MLEQFQDYIQVEQRGAVMEISINRPDKKNALNLDMYSKISDSIEVGMASTQVRVIILMGSNGCFTGGNDLAVFTEPEKLQSSDNPIFRFMSILSTCTKPVIAAVDGVAIGIGTTLLLHCDLVVASPLAMLKMPFVSLGLAPEFASTLLLPKLVGPVKASEWLLLGSNISAQEAFTAGLINQVCEQPLVAAREYAQSIVDLPPQAVQNAKALLREPVKEDVAKAIKREAAVFLAALTGLEFKEAASAFFEKRKPEFK